MKILIPAIFIFLCFACGRNPGNFEGGDPRHGEKEMLYETAIVKSPEKPDQPPSIDDRKLIRTGYLEIAVEDAVNTKAEMEKICKEFNAYVSSERQTNGDTRLEYEQVIRIPSGNFDAVVQKIELLAHEVTAKNIQTQDVTEEFIDKEARIKTKKELENRYREILKQAKEVSDILSIEAQLNHVRADIESMEGRLNYLRNQVAFSTLTLSFYKPIGAEFGFGSKTAAAFSNGWAMFLVFIIGILNLWPFLLIGGLAVFLALRKTRFRKRVSEPGPAEK